jgi:hypothetical protein
VVPLLLTDVGNALIKYETKVLEGFFKAQNFFKIKVRNILYNKVEIIITRGHH